MNLFAAFAIYLGMIPVILVGGGLAVGLWDIPFHSEDEIHLAILLVAVWPLTFCLGIIGLVLASFWFVFAYAPYRLGLRLRRGTWRLDDGEV